MASRKEKVEEISAESEANDYIVQSDEARAAILNQSTAAANTAVGVQRAEEDEENEHEIPSGEDRGAKNAVSLASAEEVVADYTGAETQKPVGAQADAAIFVTNGTLPVNMVGSPSGPVPASSLGAGAGDLRRVKEGLESLEAYHLRRAGEDDEELEPLSRAKLETMSAAEIRAVAQDRGFDLGSEILTSGRRATMRAFIREQNKSKE